MPAAAALIVDPEALARQAAARGGGRATFDAVAHEHGYASWARLRAYAARRQAHGPGMQHLFVDELDWVAERAEGLRSVARDGLPSALAIVRRHLPERGASSDAELQAGLRPAETRLVVARRHGFPSWRALGRNLAQQASGGPEPFMQAFRAIQAGSHEGLAGLLDRHPGLVDALGTNGNDLLGLATSIDRRGTHGLVELLLERGADPSRGNDHGGTPLHQAAGGGHVAQARRLLAAGAALDREARGTGGTPLVAALFWGHRQTAELLAKRSIEPRNLRGAAGLGRLDLIDELVDGAGRLRPAAGAQRGFYRPHSGFPPWSPSSEPQELLDEALTWAARNDRSAVFERLLELGARVDGDPYRGTALGWAAACGHVGAIERLVALGADPSGRATFGGPGHGEAVTPLHLAAQNGHEGAVRALLALGADPRLRDALYDSPPAGWAEHDGHPQLAALLRAAEAVRPPAAP